MRYFKIDFKSPAYSVYLKTDKFPEIFCYLDPEFMACARRIAEDLGRSTLDIVSITEIAEADYKDIVENADAKIRSYSIINTGYRQV